MRLFGRVVKWSISLLLCLICGILLWRMCSSGDPEAVKYLMGNEVLFDAYEKHGDDLVVQYQMQDTITTAEYNRGYFSVTQYVFIPEAKQVQLVFRYNNSTIKNLARDYPELAEIPDKSEELFDVTLLTTKDLTPDNRDDNEALQMERYHPSAATRTETSLYTYYRFVFDNIEVTPDTLWVFADIYYVGDLDYAKRPYGTLCLYDDESPWVDYKLSRVERKMLSKREGE